MRPSYAAMWLFLPLTGALHGACGGSGDGAPPVAPAPTVAAATSVFEPEPEPEPAPVAVEDVELALLEGFTKAVAARDIDQVASWLSPEFGAELRRMHMADPNEFWARGSIWVERAASGLVLAARGSSDGVERWRGLVRFGNGYEESVVFGRFDGRVLLADL
jgi:hypothetical protein